MLGRPQDWLKPVYDRVLATTKMDYFMTLRGIFVVLKVRAHAELERGHLIVGINLGHRQDAGRGPWWYILLTLGWTGIDSTME